MQSAVEFATSELKNGKKLSEVTKQVCQNPTYVQQLGGDTSKIYSKLNNLKRKLARKGLVSSSSIEKSRKSVKPESKPLALMKAMIQSGGLEDQKVVGQDEDLEEEEDLATLEPEVEPLWSWILDNQTEQRVEIVIKKVSTAPLGILVSSDNLTITVTQQLDLDDDVRKQLCNLHGCTSNALNREFPRKTKNSTFSVTHRVNHEFQVYYGRERADSFYVLIFPYLPDAPSVPSYVTENTTNKQDCLRWDLTLWRSKKYYNY